MGNLIEKQLIRVSKSTLRLIRDKRFIFVPASKRLDNGSSESIGIYQDDENGDTAARFGIVFVNSISGNLTLKDGTEGGGSHKLSEVPEILEAVKNALHADRDAYGKNCYVLYKSEYNWNRDN